MIIPDFVSKLKDTLIKGDMRMPCYTNRASSIGYYVPELDGCLRRGVYERTHWQEKEPYNVDTLLRFREGNNQEQILLRDFAEAGIQIIEQQSSFLWEKYQISGHLDGVVIIEEKSIPVEFKSMAPSIFMIMKTFQDFYKKPWTKAYLAQIQIYMLFKNIDSAIFFIKDKSSGDIRQINVELDYNLAESCIKTAEIINKHIENKTLPDRISNIDKCSECQFKLTCLPDMRFGVPLKIVDDPEYESKIDRYLEIKEVSDECINLWDIIKERAKASSNAGELNYMCGKYLLTANARKQFRLNIDKVA